VPCATATGFAAIAFFKPSGSAKSTYAKPFLLSISTIETTPNFSIASLRRVSVTPWDGFACLIKACMAPSDGVDAGAGFLEVAAAVDLLDEGGVGVDCCD
jgi:hypothetical protein